MAKEKIEKELEFLVEKGKISRQEMEEIVERIKARGETEESELKNKIKESIKEVLSELDLATKQDIEDLKKSMQ